MNPYFRPALTDDIPHLLKMMETFYAIDNYPFNMEKTMHNLSEFLRNDALGRMWMVELDDHDIGYFVLTFGFSFEFKGRIALLDELFIIPDFQNSGIGKSILEFIFKQATGLGLQTLLLEVEKHNSHAIHLYQKLGFRDHNRLILSRPV